MMSINMPSLKVCALVIFTASDLSVVRRGLSQPNPVLFEEQDIRAINFGQHLGRVCRELFVLVSLHPRSIPTIARRYINRKMNRAHGPHKP